MNAIEALRQCLELDIETVLDIGSGTGEHAQKFRAAGITTHTVNLQEPADYIGDYLETEVPACDLVWASHVLEHQLRPHDFLKKCFRDCNKFLCITVPPLKHEIVGGHVSLWNAGLLLYNLILAGWDCSKAKIINGYYDITVLVEKKEAKLPPLVMDYGDIQALSEFFPFPAVHGFNGDIR